MWYKVFVRGVSTVVLVLAIVITFPPDYFFFSNLQAFAFPFAIGCFLLIFSVFGVKLIAKKYQLSHKILNNNELATIGVIGFLLTSSLFYPLFSTSEISASNTIFTVGNFNIWYENPNPLATINQILASEADLIGLEEVNTTWDSLLQKHLSQKYPHYLSIPIDESYFGIAVFSKYPLKKVAQKNWASYAGIVGVVDAPFGEVAFAITHFAVPKEQYRYKIRQLQFLELADYLNQFEGYKVAIGDFNTASWAKEIGTFKENTGLLDSRKGIAPTFTASFPIIPLDHIFYSSAFKCIDFQTIKTNSDHFGVIAKLGN